MSCLESATENRNRKDRVCEDGGKRTAEDRPKRSFTVANEEQLRAASYYVLFGVPLSILDGPSSAFKEREQESPMWSLSATASLTPNAPPHVHNRISDFHQFLYVNDLHSVGQLLPHSQVSPPRLAFCHSLLMALQESKHCPRTASSHFTDAGIVCTC